MPVSPFDSQLTGPLFSDDEMAVFFSDKAVIDSMVAVEIALAKAQAEAGLIPGSAATQIAKGLEDFTPDLADMGRAAAAFGVPVPALLAAARAALPPEAAPFLHWGATSQDVVDTAMALRLKEALGLLEKGIQKVLGRLGSLAVEHAETVMVGRTRWQQAVPTTFGYKAAMWGEPLQRHLQRLAELKPRLLVLSLGGAVGNLSAMGRKAAEVEARLAEELQISLPKSSRHTQRDGMAELAGWLSMLSGSLGKVGQDLLLLAQSEVGEVHFASSGGSSTMPQKSNPIGAEVLVTLSRFNAGLVGVIHQAQIQEHERGGPGWMLEWLVLPQMIMAAAAALRHAISLMGELSVDAAAMQRNLDLSNGLCLAEAAVFALSEYMSKTQAQELVKDACQQTRRTHEHLMDVLAGRVPHPIPWSELKNPRNHVGLAAARAKSFTS
ncbi:MAG: 3-carboxy-cis,cis-muconate cycloisomerase [Desulfosarcinaceae bacterium]